LETVAAGGGSALGVVAGAYAVGPRSAGSDPGPAAYGRGGPATLTDCEAVLGRLAAFPLVCGPGRDAALDRDAAERALAALDPERPVEDVAAGFREAGQEAMAAAVRTLCARLGVDPAAHVLVGFGGAGPAHACGVARRLGIRRVAIPALASVFSAVGIGAARRRAERVVPVRAGVAAALDTALASLPFGGVVQARLAMRHVGTLGTLEVPLQVGAAFDDVALRAAFDGVHAERFGADRPQDEVEAVEVRVAVEADAPRPTLAPELDRGAPRVVRAWFNGWRDVPLLPMQDADGRVGPLLLRAPGTTLVVDEGWRVHWAGDCLLLEDEAPMLPIISSRHDPAHAAVVAARLTGLAEQMGARLARLARSVSIRERQDFSCAVFDSQGQLVVNAPHVPVHLGAMGETVRALVAAHGPALSAGDAWLSNDPYAGGSHLPDLTVIMPVFDAGGRRIAFVACRGHHVDVGGITPGSMPAGATHIAEEGMLLPMQRIAREGGLMLPDLHQSRQPQDVAADLRAQIAACRLGAAGVAALAEELGPTVLRAWLAHLQDAAEAAVRDVLRGMPGEHAAVEVLDDGAILDVRLEVQGAGAVLHIAAPAHPGNRNAPGAVARAALLYVFRCLVRDALPLNEGALRPFSIELTPGGLFEPRSPRAVAGGNVETSQRLVDALLRAVGALAGSQGTMNNLTVGTPAGAFYETIAGGMGAGRTGPGADAVQCHMTNTRATDVEELEARFPVVVERWVRRRGSGGVGRHRGGDGAEKVWRFNAPATVSLMVERRAAGAPGLAGGGDGAAGVDEVDAGDGWRPVTGRVALGPGARLRIRTPGGGGWGRA